MTFYYSSETYEQAFKKLDEVCIWLNSLDITFSRTRIGRYKEIYSALAKHQCADTLDLFQEQYTEKEYFNAVYEVGELLRIYEGLNEQCGSDFVTRLSDSLKGHELYILDSNDRSGRDFSFELSIAAKFVRHGYVIDFGDDADLKVEYRGTTFFVECKRLKSYKKVNKRIKEGLKQLHRRYAKSENPLHSRGILCISIGKIVNPNLGYIESGSPEGLGDKAFLFNRKFIDNYEKYWQTTLDKRTLGVAIVFDTLGVLEESRKLITCHEVTLNNIAPVGSFEYTQLIDIANQVFIRPR